LAQDVIHGRVVGVTDGDTIRVLTAEKQLLSVRVAWIDVPEMRQAFGRRAKQAMSALVFGKDVELRFHTVNRYSRLVCMVFVDGTDAGLELIKEGLPGSLIAT
jgi:endonuclease YncB( thermonuclease family)